MLAGAAVVPCGGFLLGVFAVLAARLTMLRRAAIAARRTTSRARSLLLFLTRFLDQRFAREPHFVAFDRQHFDQHLVAQLQFIANVADAMLGNFADVQQAVRSREEFHERAKL